MLRFALDTPWRQGSLRGEFFALSLGNRLSVTITTQLGAQVAFAWLEASGRRHLHAEE